jgi:hypothetical protein
MKDQPIPYQEATDKGGNAYSGFFPIDKLGTIFAGQTLLMERYEDQERRNGEPMPSMSDWGDLNSRTVQMRLHSLYGYMMREMSEAMAHLDAKPWKDNPRLVDENEFVEEIADTLHFFVEFCLVAGIGSSRLFHEYFRAWEKNNVRQASGY